MVSVLNARDYTVRGTLRKPKLPKYRINVNTGVTMRMHSPGCLIMRGATIFGLIEQQL